MHAGNQMSLTSHVGLNQFGCSRLINMTAGCSLRIHCSKENGDSQSGCPGLPDRRWRTGLGNVRDHWFEVRAAEQVSLMLTFEDQFGCCDRKRFRSAMTMASDLGRILRSSVRD